MFCSLESKSTDKEKGWWERKRVTVPTTLCGLHHCPAYSPTRLPSPHPYRHVAASMPLRKPPLLSQPTCFKNQGVLPTLSPGQRSPISLCSSCCLLTRTGGPHTGQLLSHRPFLFAFRAFEQPTGRRKSPPLKTLLQSCLLHLPFPCVPKKFHSMGGTQASHPLP